MNMNENCNQFQNHMQFNNNSIGNGGYFHQNEIQQRNGNQKSRHMQERNFNHFGRNNNENNINNNCDIHLQNQQQNNHQNQQNNQNEEQLFYERQTKNEQSLKDEQHVQPMVADANNNLANDDGYQYEQFINDNEYYEYEEEQQKMPIALTGVFDRKTLLHVKCQCICVLLFIAKYIHP